MKGKGPGRDLERERAWRAVVDRQRLSGLSVRGFCRREVVSEASFYAWRRELLRRDRESSSGHRPDRESGVRSAVRRSSVARMTQAATATAAAFLPVLMESNSAHVARVLEVTCGDGSRVSAWSGCEVELLQAALSVVTRTAGVGRKRRVASC
jgi:transposase-like protein